MISRRHYNPSNKDQVLDTLHREILAARLKVTLDDQLDRETSPTVQRLAKMKLPPIVRLSSHDADGRSCEGQVAFTRKEHLIDTLRREISAARLKVTLDQELSRSTSSTVKRLAQMTLPPMIRTGPGTTGQR